MEAYLGQIMMFGGNFAPRGWAMCNGQLLSIAQNTALFSLLGTTFGGDGVTTFALPDLRGRVSVGPGQGPGLSNYVIGQVGGSESVTLISTQMPAHNHLIGCSNAAGTATDPTNGIVAQVNTGDGRTPITTAMEYTAPPQTGTMAPEAVSVAGGSQPHTNLQPILCVTFCIATEGIYPSRN